MRIDRIKGMEVVRWTAEEYQHIHGESMSEWFNWVSDYVDPDEVRKATLKAWGLLKLNDHQIYEERAKRWI
mgnify:FL=1|jgi:hypothetical protein|nr:MAG TPA: hypothetical protein [Caudoviricetes sp.]